MSLQCAKQDTPPVHMIDTELSICPMTETLTKRDKVYLQQLEGAYEMGEREAIQAQSRLVVVSRNNLGWLW